MNQFNIAWTDLSTEKQTDILDTVKTYILHDLHKEQRTAGFDNFKEFMTHKNYYAIDDNEFWEMNVSEFVEEKAMERINDAFKNAYLMI